MDSTTRRGFLRHAAAVTGGVAASSIPSVAATPEQAATPATRMRQASKTSKLRAMLTRSGITVVPEATGVFTARLAELHGYEAVYVGGNMMAALHLGIEDWGLITTPELVEIGSRIAHEVDVPTIVDGDQLGETALNVYRSIKAYERAGIAGTHLEDTLNPKHLGPGKSELMSVEEMVLRIQAAVEARTDPDFLILARTDCLWIGANQDAKEAIRRGQAYAKAGADAFFVVAMRKEHVDEIASNVPIPLIGLNHPQADVANSKMKINIHAVQLYQPAAKLYEDMLLELKQHGQFLRIPERSISPETAAKVMRTEKYAELAERWRKVRG